MPQKSGLPLGLIILRNQLREGVKTTVSFLQKRGVSIRVISGDNPDTVRYIARSAGIINTDATITGADLEKLSKNSGTKPFLTRRFLLVYSLNKKKHSSTHLNDMASIQAWWAMESMMLWH